MRVLSRRVETGRGYSAGTALLAVAYLFSFYASPIFGEYAEAIRQEMAMTASASDGKDAGVPDPRFKKIESRYFTIYCRPEANFDRIARRLRKKMSYFGVSGAYGGTVQENIAGRMDAILARAKEILDMYPKMPRINIKIFKNRKELGDEHSRIFGEERKHRSFYVHKQRTIYTSEQDISDSVIAHEMGHAIIDHYFKVIPSGTASEVLARYVDLHLGD